MENDLIKYLIIKIHRLKFISNNLRYTFIKRKILKKSKKNKKHY